MRPLAILALALASGGCGSGADPVDPPPSVAAHAEPLVDPACLGLCERLAGCDRDEGRIPAAADCTRACAAGGAYAAMPAAALVCAERRSCAEVRQCAGPDVAATVAGAIAASPTEAPPDWPDDFPTVPGGAPRAVPAMGPVRVAVVAYRGRDAASTVRAYRDALAADGWALEDAAAGDGEAHRFTARRGESSVSVSIYRDGDDTMVQTMQLGIVESGR